MSWWTNARRGIAKIGGGALSGYLSGGGNWASALGGAATSAALGGLDNKQGFNVWKNIAAPAAVGYGVGQSQTGQNIDAGLRNGYTQGNGAIDTMSQMGSQAMSGAKVGALADFNTLKGLNNVGGNGGAKTIQGMVGSTPAPAAAGNWYDGLLTKDNIMTGLKMGGGALLAQQTAPPVPQYHPVDRAALDAATLTGMRRQAAERMAVVNGQVSAQGGLSSTGMYQQALAQQTLDQNIARQGALNTITANQSYNDMLARNYAAQRQGSQDLLSGVLSGYNSDKKGVK